MPRLVVSATAPSVRLMREQALAALARGADAVELRLDLLTELPAQQDLDELLRDLPGPCIITCRPIGQGGQFDATEQERLSILMHAGRATSCTIDFEFDAWRSSPNARQKVRLAAGRGGETPREPNRLMLSHHDFRGRPANLREIAAAMASVPEADAVKLVWRAADICDNFAALDLVRSLDKPATVLCMGEDGLLSRVLARKVGAAFSYCSSAGGDEAAPGQLTLNEMKHLYRWDSIDEATALFGVVGHPIAHSLSPVVHNAAFAAADVHAVYLPMHVQPGAEHLERFLRELAVRPWLNAVGLSVTAPHKVNALKLAGDNVGENVRRIGAVNTLHLTPTGIRAYNTDGEAALGAILVAVGGHERELQSLPAAVLGAGGVARAVVEALVAAGCDVTVYNRTAGPAERVAADFGCRVAAWRERQKTDAKLIVNCTSVGMWPRGDESPMPADAFRRGMIVLDTVYNPAKTRLLADASAAGALTVTGVSMFLAQAARQFEIWTGQPPPLEVMQRALEDAMSSAG